MCKEDVRIKRQTESRSVQCVSGTGQGTLQFQPRADRIAIIAALTGSINAASAYNTYVLTGENAFDSVLCSLSPGQPSAIVTLEDVGNDIQKGIRVQNTNGDNITLRLTEVWFTKALGDL